MYTFFYSVHSNRHWLCFINMIKTSLIIRKLKSIYILYSPIYSLIIKWTSCKSATAFDSDAMHCIQQFLLITVIQFVILILHRRLVQWLSMISADVAVTMIWGHFPHPPIWTPFHQQAVTLFLCSWWYFILSCCCKMLDISHVYMSHISLFIPPLSPHPGNVMGQIN